MLMLISLILTGSGFFSFSQSSKTVIKLALLTDLTGTNQRGGNYIKEGTELAVDAINKSNGIAGRYTLELILEDAKSSPTEAVNAANRLINRGDISFVIGPLLSNETLPVQPMFAAAGIPQIMVATSDRLLTDRHKEAPLSIRFGGQDLHQFAPVAKYAVSVRKHKKFFALAADTGDGRAGLAAFKEILEKLGGTLLQSEFYPFGSQDFSTLVAKYKTSNAEALVVSDVVPTAVIAIFEEYVRQGLPLEKFYGREVLGNQTFYELVASKGRADGMIFSWFYDDGTSPREFESGETPALEALAMSDAFRARFGQPPGPAGLIRAWGWGSVKLIQQAIEGLIAEKGANSVSALNTVKALPEAVVQYILKGATNTETGPKFRLSFGDKMGFFACGQSDAPGGVATYRKGVAVLLQDRNWANDLISGLCR
jgi:branched-chain amino acid transport system substrate-binding protein